MSELLPFLVIGIVAGSVYGAAGVGLVLTYRTSGIFNFAHGAVGAAGAYVFYEFLESGVPWPLALAASVVLLGGGAGLALERLGRRLTELQPVNAIVGTIGLLLLIQGLLTWHFGPETLSVPAFLPTSGFRLGGVNITWDQLIVTMFTATAVVGLYAFLRFSSTGVAMRAVVDDPALVSLTGITPGRVRAIAWVIGSAFAVLSGILIAPSLGLEAVLLTLLVVQAFGACAIGRFSSLPLTYLGGLLIGVLAALATKYVRAPVLSGLPSSLPFLVLLVVLMLTPKGGLPVRTTRGRRGALSGALPRRVVVACGAVVATSLVAVPWLVGPRLPVWTNGVTYGVLFLSLSLLVHTSGQISLCHAAFAALGATTFSHLASGLGLPWLLALLGAGLATIPLGMLVALPAIRLSGIYLAIATFGLGILIERIGFGTGLMFGGSGYRSAPRPDLWLLGGGTDRQFYFVALLVLGVACGVVLAVRHAQLGRFLQGLAESPTSLVTAGLDVNITRLLVFCLSALVAGVAGALFIAASGQASGVGFGSFESLTLLAVLAIAGTRPLLSPLVAAAALAVIPAYLPDGFADYQTMAFGAFAILAACVADSRPRFDVAGAEERRRLSPVKERRLAPVTGV